VSCAGLYDKRIRKDADTSGIRNLKINIVIAVVGIRMVSHGFASPDGALRVCQLRVVPSILQYQNVME